MRFLRNLLFRLRALLRPGAMERELNEELAFHMEMEEKKLSAIGHQPSEAKRLAQLHFGSQAAERERARDSWGITMVRDFLADLRHAFRQFRRRPAFSALGILTLALGLGATVGLAGVTRSVLLRPLPVSDEASLRILYFSGSWRGIEYDYLREGLKGFTGLAAYVPTGTALRTDAQSTVLLGGLTSANLFEVHPAGAGVGAGRRAGADAEDRPAAGAGGDRGAGDAPGDRPPRRRGAGDHVAGRGERGDG